MRRLLALITVAALFAVPAVGVEIPDEQKLILRNLTNGTEPVQGELFDDLDSWSFIPSQIQPPSSPPTGEVKDSVICSSVDDPKCKDLLALNVKAFLPSCSSEKTLYCIETFFAVVNGKKVNGTYVQNYPAERTLGQFDEDSRYKIPAGGSGSIWKLPGVTHAGGSDTYWLNAQLLGSLLRKSTSESFPTMNVNQIWSSISAVTEVSVPGSVPPEAYSGGGTKSNSRPITLDGRQCLMAGKDACLIAWPLDQNISYGMTVRMAEPISGWLHGRLDKPEFQTTIDKAGRFHLTMAGKPVKVPTLFASTEWSKASQAIKSRFGSAPSGCCSFGNGFWYDSAGRNQSGEEMVADLRMWIPYVEDKASATPTYWITRTIQSGMAAKRSQCFAGGEVNGVVTTNATAYSSGAPTFNEKSQSLDYQVAAPHFDASGGLNVGTYNLQIDGKVARCLYGFSNAPLSATVTIISENGKSQVATSSLKEDKKWIYLNVSGFTYSNPTLRVVLKQKSTTSSITCVKNGVTKKVTSKSSVCPKGFKRA
ncbi:MAG: hypothetical protein EBX97_06755 [Actinobacteria bacterium]|nr:hypothetical protein [Actinomycetota bacterium]